MVLRVSVFLYYGLAVGCDTAEGWVTKNVATGFSPFSERLHIFGESTGIKKSNGIT